MSAILYSHCIASKHSMFTHLTCEPRYGHEDTLSHLKSALCMKKLENLLNDTFDRVLPMTLWLQAQGRCIAYFCPEEKHLKCISYQVTEP